MSVQFPMSYFSDGVGVAVLVQDGVNIDEIADVNAIYIDECGGDAHWLSAHVNFDNESRWTSWTYSKNAVLIARNMSPPASKREEKAIST